MNSTLIETARPTRFNTNRSESPKDQKGAGKTITDTSRQLTGNGFEPSQIGSVLDKISGNQLHRPWEDSDGWTPSFENPIKPSTDLKPIDNLKPVIDLKPILKPVIDKPVNPITDLFDIIKPAIEKPENPFPGFPLPDKPVRPHPFPQPEVELADPGLTDVHQAHNDSNPLNVADDITFQDIDGEIIVDGIELTDIEQGYVADCYLCAALGSIALHNPEYIENMITDNGNGTYTVSFGGELGDVTVDDDFPINQDGNVVYAQTTGDGTTPELWVAIIEKAFAQAHSENSYQGIEFGWPSNAIAHITGQTNFTVDAPSAFTPQSLQAALNNGQSVTALTPKDPDGAGKGKSVTPDGLVFNHAYVITDVRQNAKTGEWEVVVYNPHRSDPNTNDGQDDGFTVLTMEQFNTNFQFTEVSSEPVG